MTSICRGLNPNLAYYPDLKVTNWEDHECRAEHRERVEAQLKKFLRLSGFEVSTDVLRSRVDMPRMFAKTVDRRLPWTS